MNNKDYFTILQLIRDLLFNIRFYTANVPQDILSTSEWDKMRKNFSEIDDILSKSQGYISNQAKDLVNNHFDDKDEGETLLPALRDKNG